MLASAAFAAKIPAALSVEEAATIPVCVPSVVKALFHSTGLGLPLFDNGEGFDYRSKTILVLGGGSNCGKAAIQLARMVGFGTIVTVAGKTPAKEAALKALGATAVVDRRSGSLASDVRAAVGDDLVYAIETVASGDGGHTLGVSALSDHLKGTLVTITHGTVDESAAGEKKAGYEKRFTVGSSHAHPEFAAQVWSKLPAWVQSDSIKPFRFRTIKGLDTAEVNAALDEYRSGGEVVKAIVLL